MDLKYDCPECKGIVNRIGYDYICSKCGNFFNLSQLLPTYYGDKESPYEAIKIIQHYNLNFNKGNVIKYLIRAGKKDGATEIKDLQKARDYINYEIERIVNNS